MAKDVVLMTGAAGATTWSDKLFVDVLLMESVIEKTRFAVTAVVGVPEITPVFELSESPAGKVPEVTANV